MHVRYFVACVLIHHLHHHPFLPKPVIIIRKILQDVSFTIRNLALRLPRCYIRNASVQERVEFDEDLHKFFAQRLGAPNKFVAHKFIDFLRVKLYRAVRIHISKHLT